jgi:multidrug efflux pump subunit AcrB
VLGGLLTAWLGPELLPHLVGLPTPPAGEEPSAFQEWLVWGIFFVPGALAGGGLGWFVIRPVNAVLGWVFRGFNRLFDSVTALYGQTVAWLLRLSVVALILYGGLLVLTGWQFVRAPTGFIPQQARAT